MNFNKWAISLLLLTCFQFSFAQNIITDTIIRPILLNEVIISANKEPELIRTLSQQAQVLKANNIADAQAQTSADLLATSANIFVQKSQMGGGSPVLRGFEANRIVLVVDGIRMNNLIYRGGHLQNIVTLDNSIMNRIEVLYGPSSNIYGSDALGGVIHLMTKKPVFKVAGAPVKPMINAFTRYGSVNNEMTGHLDLNIGLANFASLTSFTYSQFGDLRSGTNQNPYYWMSYGERPYYVERINNKDSLVKNSDRYLQVQSAYTQYDLLQKFLIRTGDHITHGINIQYSNSSNVPRYDRLTDPAGGGLKYSEWYYGPQMRLLTAYDLNYTNPDAHFESVHFGVNYQSIEESRHQRRFGKDNLQSRIENVSVIGTNLDFIKKMNKNTIRFGLDAQLNTLVSTATQRDIVADTLSPLDTRYPDGDNSMNSFGLYVSHSWKINDQLTLNDGIRVGYTTLHSTFVDTTFFHLPFNTVDQKNPVYSGSIGLVNNPSYDWKISLLLSTGFRVPNIDDLAKVFESASGALIVPNNNLKPEKTVNTEIGVTHLFGDHAMLESNLYYTRIFDAIVTDKFQFKGEDSVMYNGSMSQVMANQNKRHAYIYGFSSSLNMECGENFLFSAMMNYTYGRIKTDSMDVPLDHIPPFMARASVTYTKKNFSTNFFVNYNGWKKLKDYYLNGEDNEAYATPDGMPAWITFNMRASLKVCKLLTVQAGVDNILDTQYRYFASGINAPGRNAFAAIRFHY